MQAWWKRTLQAEEGWRKLYWLPLAAALLGFSWLVLSHSWFSNDAYFSFRTIDNFVNGYGLRWNVAERVQVYTHPLWVLLLTPFYALSGNIYLTSIFISLFLTLGVVIVLARGLAETPWQGLAAALLLSLSTAFIDYSSPGLENPLSHFLLAVFLLVFFHRVPSERRLFWLALIASLGAVNRLDTILFYLPPLAIAWWRSPQRWRAAGILALGMLPLVLWELFSLIYYGLPFPNTFYAKTQNAIPLDEKLFSGLNYLAFTARFDPITWVGILAGLAVALWRRAARGLALAAGILLYLIYLLFLGGDFMGGRFLSTAYLASIVLAAVYLLPRLRPRTLAVVLPLALLLSLAGSSPSYYLYPKDFEKSRLPLAGNTVVDERREFYTTNFVRLERFYEFNTDPQYSLANKLVYLANSIVRGSAFRTQAEHDWFDLGEQLRARAQQQGPFVTEDWANGFTGFAAGPDVHFIQNLSLTDPFLAQLPPMYASDWRSAHFTRIIPEGYIEVAAGTRQHLADAQLDPFFQQIWTLTRGDLFTAERAAAFWQVNVVGFDGYMPGRADEFTYPLLKRIMFDTEEQWPAEGVAFRGCCGLALQIDFAAAAHASSISLEMEAGDDFRFYVLDADGEAIWSTLLKSAEQSGVEIFEVAIPSSTADAGYYAFRLVPTRIFYELPDNDYRFFSLELAD